MDSPKTRFENKKNQKEKSKSKSGKYSQKHIRIVEMVKEKQKTKQ